MLNLIKKIVFAAAVVMTASPVFAADWGSLKGRFVVDGTPAELPALQVDKDAVCMEAKPKNQALVIGDGNALANVVVYLRAPRTGKIAIHPDYEAELSKPVVLDNRGCEFHPHITLVRVGQPLEITNSDPTGHNTNVNVFSFNQTIPAMGKTQIKAPKDSPLPTPVVCNIHPFMKGHLLSLKHPYMAASGEDGTFEIKNLPVGKHEIQLWHEVPGYMKDLTTKAGKANRQGRVNVTITAGETVDLGDVKVPASMLKAK